LMNMRVVKPMLLEPKMVKNSSDVLCGMKNGLPWLPFSKLCGYGCGNFTQKTPEPA